MRKTHQKPHFRKYLLIVVTLLPMTGCMTNSGGFIENDTFALDSWLNANEDRNLTQTSGISWKAHEDPDIVHRSLLGLNDIMSVKTCKEENVPTSTVAISVYTPDDLQSFEPVEQDRPYATYLALSANRSSHCYKSDEDSDPINDKLDEIWRTGLSVGFLGLTLGEDAQRWLHETAGVSSNRPNGWDNQISDGGEPTFLYTVERSKLLREYSPSNRRSQWSYTLGGSVGYNTNVFASLSYRKLLAGQTLGTVFDGPKDPFITIGTLSTKPPQIPDAPVVPELENLPQTSTANPTSNSVGQPAVQRDKGRTLLLSARAYAVAYNALLQGQFRDSEPTFDREDMYTGVFQFTAALTDNLQGWCKLFSLNYLWGNPTVKKWCGIIVTNPTRMSFALHARTSEYKAELERPHIWAGFYFNNIDIDRK